MSKTDKKLNLRNILKKESSSQSVKLLTCWKLHLAQFRASERQYEHALTAISKTMHLFTLPCMCLSISGFTNSHSTVRQI
jgi:hypothetical protein